MAIAKLKLKTKGKPEVMSDVDIIDSILESDDCSYFTKKATLFSQKLKLAMYMKRGLDVKEAAKLLRISEYQLGILRSDPEFEDFIAACSARCESTHLNNIHIAGKLGAWQASAWVLERKFPDKYGKKDVVRHEYEMKFMSFQKIILGVVNKLPSDVKQIFMKELRNINLAEEMDDILQIEQKTGTK